MTHATLAEAILVAAPLLPMALAIGFIWPRAHRVLEAMTPWAAAPALMLGLLPAGSEVAAPGFVLEIRLAVDATGRVFLLLNGLLWPAAALFARSYLQRTPTRPMFFAFFLAAMAGSIGTCVAGDAASFYTFYSIASFAAWPLVMYDRTRAARRAARVYLSLVVIGEACVFVAIALYVADTGTWSLAGRPHAPGTWQLLLTIAGFGIKAGAMPLHVWLPLAHPVAPTPASAVLSGVMIKAGLLGWIRFLPLGEASFPLMGATLTVIGLTGTFGGVILGLLQQSAKAALAYSSVSQMGFLVLGVGVALAHSSAWPALLPALLLYALHHGLAKAALFLGIGVFDTAAGTRQRRVTLALMAIPGLALAGAPFSSGALAKQSLKSALPASAGLLGAALPWLLPLAAAGTALLMVRVLTLTHAREHGALSDAAAAHERETCRRLTRPWLAVLGLVILAASPSLVASVLEVTVAAGKATAAALPVAMAVVVSGAGIHGIRRANWQVPALPPGDLLIPLGGLARRIRRWARPASGW